MPLITRLRNSCHVPAESSTFSSIKSILCRRFFKKRTSIKQNSTQSQMKSKRRSSHKSKTINNYDMTILHEDELENPHLATVRRRKKTIPSWANKDQLQLAIINQVYFQNQNPEEIFGTICIEQVHEIIHSIDNANKTSVSMISSRHFV